jgi:hypothetical protein
MGVWTKLDNAGTYKERPVEEPGSEREQKLYAEVDRLKVLPLTEIVAAIEAAKAKKAAATALEKEGNFELQAADTAMQRAMKAQGLETVVVGGWRCTPSPEPYGQVKDKAQLLDWALEHMRDNLSLHHGTLQSLVKSALKGEGELPPGLDIYMGRSISFTKAKG